jgi:hypothetical protein
MKQLLTLLKKIKKDANTAIKMIKDELASNDQNDQLEASTPIIDNEVETNDLPDLSVETPETIDFNPNENETNPETEGGI